MKLFRRKRAQRQPKPRRIIFLRKRYLASPGAILVICALCLVITLPTYVTASTTDRQLPIYCVQRDYKVCSLTFDAAWGNAILRHIFPLTSKRTAQHRVLARSLRCPVPCDKFFSGSMIQPHFRSDGLLSQKPATGR